jgi:membrane protease YdiL (CAAX protease family)
MLESVTDTANAQRDLDATRRPKPSGATSSRFLQLALEFLFLFLAIPAALALYAPTWIVFPAMWSLAALSLIILLRDDTFDRAHLWNCSGVRSQIRPMLQRFAVCATILAAALAIYDPSRLLQLPISHTPRWALIMLLYPVLSVYPQELAFRAFFTHRYRDLFPRRTAILIAGALAFGFAHVLLHNGFAVALCVVGGVFFACTYERSRSLAAACLEHALYGCFLFTIGWGSFFYSGALSR